MVGAFSGNRGQQGLKTCSRDTQSEIYCPLVRSIPVSGSSRNVFWQVGKKGIKVLSLLFAAGGWFGREHLHIAGNHLDACAPNPFSIRVLAL